MIAARSGRNPYDWIHIIFWKMPAFLPPQQIYFSLNAYFVLSKYFVAFSLKEMPQIIT